LKHIPFLNSIAKRGQTHKVNESDDMVRSLAHPNFICLYFLMLFSGFTNVELRAQGMQSSADVLDEIVATVDGEPIMRSDLEAMILRLRADDAYQPSTNANDLARSALTELINEQLILKAGKEKEIKPPEPDISQAVDEQIERLRKTFATKGEFQQFLDDKGLTLDALRNEFREHAEKEYVIRTAINRRVSISDDDVKKYEAQLRQLKKPVYSYHLRHILLRCPQGAAATQEEQTQGWARELMIRLQKGENFELLAQQASEDQATRSQGGDLGFLNEGEFLQPLERAVKDITPGEIAGPVRTDVGYHIVKLVQKRTARWQLYTKRFEEEKQTWAEQLRKKAIINVAATYR
jgi:peptidyl-prolyl cis-trans isomerase SurA